MTIMLLLLFLILTKRKARYIHPDDWFTMVLCMLIEMAFEFVFIIPEVTRQCLA